MRCAVGCSVCLSREATFPAPILVSSIPPLLADNSQSPTTKTAATVALSLDSSYNTPRLHTVGSGWKLLPPTLSLIMDSTEDREAVDNTVPEAAEFPAGGGNHPIAEFTFRARGVPLEWSGERLRSFFADQPSYDDPTVHSLANEINGHSKTGTVTFHGAPFQLRTLPKGKPWFILLPRQDNSHAKRPQYIALDRDFLGISTLYAPPPQDHRVESVAKTKLAFVVYWVLTFLASSVIAISGLGGHAFGSFKQRGRGYMWLRDAIPYDVTCESTENPMARVMIYGYESGVPQSKKIQNLEDLGTSFRDSLLPLANSPTTKPIILVAHSLGGLIAKEVSFSTFLVCQQNPDRVNRP